jgi:hypothetical protein
LALVQREFAIIEPDFHILVDEMWESGLGWRERGWVRFCGVEGEKRSSVADDVWGVVLVA